ncbi:hypothetical protein SEVIR_3G121000v4 [Setaria viridis]|uniref:Rhamnogalacturonan endolyase n=2 Tax=Setaria viridis TaxID=4556 RepID=A0A4V6D9E4_SETVI|nr:hypothetical protein SEVIR_3G121000v2 [Setaria viridis]
MAPSMVVSWTMAAAPRWCLKLAVGASMLVLLVAAAPPQAAGGVTLRVDPGQVVVDNGVVQVSLSRPQGQITGIRYGGGGDQNLLEYNASQGNSGGYWDVVWNYPGSDHPGGTMDILDGTEFQVVSSSEEQVELSFRSSYNASRPNSVRLNVDKRLVMLRDSSGFYCYAIFEHAREHPALNISVARLAFKLNAAKFNYMAISDGIQRYMPSAADRDPPRGVPLAYKEAVLLVDPVEPEFRGEVDDKYQYSMDNEDNTVHGWIAGSNDDDPAAATGFWVVTPSNEFKNGGPLKRELTSHVGPTSLSVFLGPHYVGRDMVIEFEEGEYWKKVLGPVFIYLNSGRPDSKRGLWEDAKARAQAEVRKWPYDFPRSPDFAKAGERGSVTGRLWVRDGVANKQQQPAAMAYVGLAAPGQPASWATESKRYQFWTRAASDGSFSIGDVREGVYNLYAWVPGILGDYMHTFPVTVTPAGGVDVGNLVFEPPRSGPTLWEIGVPDRSAAEFYVPDPDPRYSSRLFLTKDRYRQYGLWERYAALYPDSDLVFTVGESNHSTDWFFAHVTRKVVGGKGDTTVVPTTWQIRFHLDRVVAGGNYTLRVALAASHMSSLQVQVNGGGGDGAAGTRGAPAAAFLMGDNNAIARHGIRGTEWSLDLGIDGRLLIRGDNTIDITQASALNQFVGVMYDYIRLEGPST